MSRPVRGSGRFVPFEDRHSSVAAWPAGEPFPVPIDEDGRSHFQMKTWGSWGTVVGITALAVSQEFPPASRRHSPRTAEECGVTVYGVRTMQSPRESGYNMEGRVSVGGRTCRAFTSSQLFRVEGRLVDVAVLHACPRETSEERQTRIRRVATEPHARCRDAERCVEPVAPEERCHRACEGLDYCRDWEGLKCR